jgi:hypothetical protein
MQRYSRIIAYSVAMNYPLSVAGFALVVAVMQTVSRLLSHASEAGSCSGGAEQL